ARAKQSRADRERLRLHRESRDERLRLRDAVRVGAKGALAEELRRCRWQRLSAGEESDLVLVDERGRSLRPRRYSDAGRQRRLPAQRSGEGRLARRGRRSERRGRLLIEGRQPLPPDERPQRSTVETGHQLALLLQPG